MTTSEPQHRSLPRLFWGVLLVCAGLALLLDPYLGTIHISASRLWPLLLIALGIAKMTGIRPGRRRNSGVGLVLIGGWLLVNTLSDWSYHETWPVLIMFLGIRMIWSSLDERRGMASHVEPGHVD